MFLGTNLAVPLNYSLLGGYFVGGEGGIVQAIGFGGIQPRFGHGGDILLLYKSSNLLCALAIDLPFGELEFELVILLILSVSHPVL